ncbi:MAG: cobalamin biosynthesis protein [Candidatus Bathyarchaeota archaeon]
MPIENILLFVVSVIVLALALIIDTLFGDPANRFHPTAWMGKAINFLKSKFRSQNPKIEKLNGVFLAILVILIFSIPAYFFLSFVWQYLGLLPYVIASAILLKHTFAIRAMENHVAPIANAIEHNNLEEARRAVAYIVSRNPTSLNKNQVVSATVESIAESTVDGIVSPIFYFCFFGILGAITYRVINTLDSMVGYRDKTHIHLGWFSAKLDSVANFIPARSIAFLMMIASILLKEDWRNTWRILNRDRAKTSSWNAGYPMSAMAGALNIQLEKPGSYILGDPNHDIETSHIYRALRITKLSTFLFTASIAIPALFLTTIVMGVRL